MTKMHTWPHAPSRLVKGGGNWMVTASTYQKRHILDTGEKLSLVQQQLFECALEFGWELQAWAVFINHYHFVAHCPDPNADIGKLTKKLHGTTAISLNEMDETPGRRIWYRARATALTFERSYFARLAYVHQNPVNHGLVKRAVEYPWCSAGWFESRADPTLYTTVYSFKTDRLNIDDDF